MPDLARMIGGIPEGLVLRPATVTAPPATDNTATIQFGTAATPISGIRALASASFKQGDVVWVVQNGYDFLIIGKVGKPLVDESGTRTTLYDGLEIYQPAGTPYVDFHRSANAAGDANADYNVRLINDVNGWLHLAGGGLYADGALDSGLAKMSTHPIHTSYAWFGHESMAGSSQYGFMQDTGETLVNGPTTKLRSNGSDRFTVNNECHTSTRLNITGGSMVWSDWYRIKGTNGLYFEDRGTGWHSPGADWIESYNDRRIYTGSIVRAGSAYIQTWADSGGHAVLSCWGAANSKGWMVRNDGNNWAMYETQTFFRGNDGGDYFNFYRFGDVRMNVPTVAPGDPDLRIAASHQLLRNASNRRLKKNIRPLKWETNPVWSIPVVRYQWKDDAREHGHRFNERHPQGYPGFIAEELFEVAPDACTIDTMTGEPNGPDNWALLAYLVAGIQELRDRIDTQEGKE